MRGVARPCLALFITDLVTTAPISRRSKNCESSLPELAQPLAVKIGAGNQAFPNVVEKSNVVSLMQYPLVVFYRQDPMPQAFHP